MDKDKSGPFFLVKSVAPIKNTKIKSTKVTVEKIDIGAPRRASSAHFCAPRYHQFVFFCSLIFFDSCDGPLRKVETACSLCTNSNKKKQKERKTKHLAAGHPWACNIMVWALRLVPKAFITFFVESIASNTLFADSITPQSFQNLPNWIPTYCL